MSLATTVLASLGLQVFTEMFGKGKSERLRSFRFRQALVHCPIEVSRESRDLTRAKGGLMVTSLRFCGAGRSHRS